MSTPSAEHLGPKHVVHVHTARLQVGDDDWTLLSKRERQRAEAFKFDVHRHRYVAAHARLRRQLGQCCGRAPEDLEFGEGAFGKPFIEGSPWEFNLSHSDEEYAAAFCEGAPVGIDVETGAHLADDESSLVAHVFHPKERERWQQERDAVERRRLFLCYWTGKEACLKAIGCGLQVAPKKVCLRGDPRDGGADVVVEAVVPEGADQDLSWKLRFLDMAATRVLAVVARPHCRLERVESPFDA